MKLTVKTVKVPALFLAIVMAFACFANVGGRNASAAAAYGEELVTNGDFEDFRSEFGADIEETNPVSPQPVPLGAYEDRKYDCYNSSSLNGGQAQFVQDGEKAYVRMYYDGAQTTTFDSMDLWVQPGWLGAGQYTVTVDFKLIGFSTGDCFAVKYNGQDEIAQNVFNAEEYAALADSEIDGLKKTELTFHLDAGNEFPAVMLWLYHKKTAGIEAHVYRVTYRDAENNIVYCNDFTAPFSKISEADIPYGEYEDRGYNGIYCASEGEFNAGYGKLVRERRTDGTTETYARLYDNDKTETKDTMSLWIQPGFIEAGNYKFICDFLIMGNNAAQYCEFNVNETSEGKKQVIIKDGQTLFDLPVTEQGYKRVEIDYTLDEGEQFNAVNVWFFHGNDNVRELRLFDVKIVDRDTEEVVYENDFSVAFENDKVNVGSEHGFNDANNAYIVMDGENVVLEMAGTDSAFNTPLDIDGVGRYLVEFDVKPSDDYNGKLEFFFAAVDMTYNSASTTAAGKKSDFEFLDDAETEGYYRYSASVLINNFMEPHVLSLYTTFKGSGSVRIDNLSVKKIEGSVTRHETPSTEGLTYRDLVLGGDFEYLNAGYTMIPEPDESSYFWGSSDYDAPGRIVDLDGNKALLIAYDPENEDKLSNRWASSFVFLDVSEFNTEDVFTLSYRYKYEGAEGFDPGIGLQVTFIGATGVEHFVQYLNYTEWLRETSGVNVNEYPFVLETDDDGWTTVTLTFKMDSAFVSQVDSIRFLNYNDCNENVKLYIDDVKFGVWSEKTSEPDPNPPAENPEDKGGCSCSGAIGAETALLGMAAVGTSGVIVFRKRRNGRNK